ncbi:hypothetical protein AAHC03_016591 [Spirometra sp. Aus1]
MARGWPRTALCIRNPSPAPSTFAAGVRKTLLAIYRVHFGRPVLLASAAMPFTSLLGSLTATGKLTMPLSSFQAPSLRIWGSATSPHPGHRFGCQSKPGKTGRRLQRR